MPVSLPQVLSTDDDEPAIAQLHRYYGPAFGSSNAYTGSAFDAWDSTGTRENDVNRFTADDVVAVIFLSVEVTPKAAHALLQAQADRFSGLLEDVGPDRDLVDDDAVLDDNWAGWTLDRELRNLPGVGHTTASKLFARKRPRLRPIYDSEVAATLGTAKQHWRPIHEALRADGRALHQRLAGLRASAGLPEAVSALRVLDVLAWLEGKDRARATV